jgi:hypothetical protein
MSAARCAVCGGRIWAAGYEAEVSCMLCGRSPEPEKDDD